MFLLYVSARVLILYGADFLTRAAMLWRTLQDYDWHITVIAGGAVTVGFWGALLKARPVLTPCAHAEQIALGHGPFSSYLYSSTHPGIEFSSKVRLCGATLGCRFPTSRLPMCRAGMTRARIPTCGRPLSHSGN